MHTMRRIALLCAAWSLAGCVTPAQPTLRSDAAFEPGSGYIAGIFTGSEYAFGIVDAVGQVYVMSFGASARGAPEGRFAIIAVPPGEYRVHYWRTGSTATLMKHPVLSRPFPVKAGQVLFLGSFRAHTDVSRFMSVTTYRYSLKPNPIAANWVVSSLAAAYPSFAGVPVQCILCIAAADDVGTVSAPPPEPEQDRGVVLHYHRPSGSYEGWGLHVWEDVPGKEQRFVKGVTWETPLRPDGTDGFGAYWLLNDTEFKSGRVGFVLHNGEVRDGAKPRLWFLKDAREVWLNADDDTLYVSEDEAVAVSEP